MIARRVAASSRMDLSLMRFSRRSALQAPDRNTAMTQFSLASTAVVLSGGGANAAYGVGVLKALLRGESPATDFQPLEPQIYVGTSGGGINAAIMVSQPGAD